MTDTTSAAGAPLTGGKVLAMLLAFFAVVFAVNGLLAFDAISTFRGEVVAQPYEAGLKFNSDIAAAAAQNQRNWKVDVSLSDGVSASFRDAEGRAVEGLAVTGAFAARIDSKLDHTFALNEIGPGLYTLAAPAPAGLWEFQLEAKRGAQTMFQSRNRVTLR